MTTMKQKQTDLIRGHRRESVLLTESELQDLRGNFQVITAPTAPLILFHPIFQYTT